jgi:excisionase family DNA binding protein
VIATADDRPRFLLLSDVAEILNISSAQVYALVRKKQLPAIKVGGRGQYRVEVSALEDYIRRAYKETEEFLDAHPFGREEDEAAD